MNYIYPLFFFKLGFYPLITLGAVFCFLTGSTHVPINWRETQHKVVFRHPKLSVDITGFHPVVKTCPAVSELLFPITDSFASTVEIWNHAIQSLNVGFTRA